MTSSELINPLIECPFCKKKMKGKALAGHIKRSHTNGFKVATKKENISTPLLDGFEVKSPDLIHELQNRVIDEQGFLVSPDLIPETKIKHNSSSRDLGTGSVRKIGQPKVFESIKSLDTKIPGAKNKKFRPHPSKLVLCPICHQSRAYKDLFDHITINHKEQKARIILAKFNREYEIQAKANPNINPDDDDPTW